MFAVLFLTRYCFILFLACWDDSLCNWNYCHVPTHSKRKFSNLPKVTLIKKKKKCFSGNWASEVNPSLTSTIETQYSACADLYILKKILPLANCHVLHLESLGTRLLPTMFASFGPLDSLRFRILCTHSHETPWWRAMKQPSNTMLR